MSDDGRLVKMEQEFRAPRSMSYHANVRLPAIETAVALGLFVFLLYWLGIGFFLALAGEASLFWSSVFEMEVVGVDLMISSMTTAVSFVFLSIFFGKSYYEAVGRPSRTVEEYAPDATSILEIPAQEESSIPYQHNTSRIVRTRSSVEIAYRDGRRTAVLDGYELDVLSMTMETGFTRDELRTRGESRERFKSGDRYNEVNRALQENGFVARSGRRYAWTDDGLSWIRTAGLPPPSMETAENASSSRDDDGTRRER